MEEKEEQLFICSHDQECDNPHCLGHQKHKKTENCMWDSYCDHADCEVSCIPYKEEPEKSCDNCGANEIRTGTNCFHTRGICTEELQGWISKEDWDKLKKEKPEPKTKRVAVIWFGDVPVDYVRGVIEITRDQREGVEFIDGDLVSEGFSGEVGGGSYKIYKVIEPPTPEPETVEDVLKRTPNHFSTSVDQVMDFIKDLNEAQERVA